MEDLYTPLHRITMDIAKKADARTLHRCMGDEAMVIEYWDELSARTQHNVRTLVQNYDGSDPVGTYDRIHACIAPPVTRDV